MFDYLWKFVLFGIYAAEYIVILFDGFVTIQAFCCQVTEHGLCLLKKLCSKVNQRNSRNILGILHKFDIITLSALKHNTVDMGRIRARKNKQLKMGYWELQNRDFMRQIRDAIPNECQTIWDHLTRIRFNQFSSIHPSLLNVWSQNAQYLQVSRMLSARCNGILLLDLRENANVVNIVSVERRIENAFTKVVTTQQILFDLADNYVNTSQYEYGELTKALLRHQ